MGTLYLVSTPIGNLEDITLRALKVLREVDLILCEDTRQTLKLINHHDIRKPLESFFEHNESAKVSEVIKMLSSGKNLALVTDSGTPSISDPGFRLVRRAVEKAVKIVPVPGPSAVITALSASALPSDRFTFVGFLPSKEVRRLKFLESLKNCSGTIVAYESPNRLVHSLRSVLEAWGDVPVCVAREMTKIHEEFFRGRLREALRHFEVSPVRGEVTLVISRPEG